MMSEGCAELQERDEWAEAGRSGAFGWMEGNAVRVKLTCRSQIRNRAAKVVVTLKVGRSAQVPNTLWCLGL